MIGYYTPDGKLIYAGEPGQVCPIPNWSGYGSAVSLGDRQNAVGRAATQGSRFGSPLVLSRVHWVRPEMVVEVSYVEWTPDGLLRHVVLPGRARR